MDLGNMMQFLNQKNFFSISNIPKHENILGDWEHLHHGSQTGVYARFGPVMCFVWPLHFVFVFY